MLQIEIIGIIGVIGSGKSYKQKQYIDQGFAEINFADAPKELIYSALNWKPESKESERLFKDSYNVSLMDVSKIPNKLINSLSGRQFLINLSQKLKTLVHENIWIDQTIINLNRLLFKGFTKFVISDVRFYNELYALKNFKYYREKEFYDKVDLKFIFSNYKSESYTINRGDISEELAISFLDKGYSDGEIIKI